MRKSTLRAYLGMVEMVDDLHSRKEYRQASRGIVRCLLSMLEEEKLAAETDNKECQAKVAARKATATKVRKKQSENKHDKEPNGKKKDFDHDGSLAAVKMCEEGYLIKAFEYCEDLKKYDVQKNDYESALNLLHDSKLHIEDLGEPDLSKKVGDEISQVEKHLEKNDLDWL
jgi:hypothetical protein